MYSSFVFFTTLYSSSYLFQLTHIIAEKEKKSQTYQSGKLDALSDEKVAKIKKFSKDYIAKVLHRLDKSKGSHRPAASTSTPDFSRTPDTGGKDQGTNSDDIPEMSVNDALGFDDDDMDVEDPSPASDVQGPEPVVAVVDVEMDSSTFILSNQTDEDTNQAWDNVQHLATKIADSVLGNL